MAKGCMKNDRVKADTILEKDRLEEVVDSLLLARYMPAAVVVDGSLEIKHFRGHTSRYLEHVPGRANFHILSMARPGLGRALSKLTKEAAEHGTARGGPFRIIGGENDALALIDTFLIEDEAAGIGRHFLIVFHAKEHHTPAEGEAEPMRENKTASDIVRGEYEMVQSLLARTSAREKELQDKIDQLQKTEAALKQQRTETEQLLARERAEREHSEAVQGRDDLMMRSALESIGEGVVVIAPDMKIVAANGAAATILESSCDELIGRHFHRALPLFDANGKRIALEKRASALALKHNERVEFTDTNDVRLMSKSGREVPVWLVATPLTHGSEVLGAVCTIRDVTRLQREQQAKSEFISLASHQLRTPLSVISLNLELLERMCVKAKLGREEYDVLKTMERASKRMIDLMNVLLSLARLESGTLKPHPQNVSLQKLTTEVSEQLAALAKEHRVQVRSSVKGGTVKTDPQFLHMILQNLLSNAVKYSKERGRVSYKVEVVRGTLALTVRDKGFGIPKEEQAKMFNRLFRASNAVHAGVEGTGLGLYLVERMVRELGGRIWFESRLHHGSTFYVTFPVGTATGSRSRSSRKHSTS